MNWALFIFIYLSLTLVAAFDETDYNYYERTLKDILMNWIAIMLGIPICFLSIVLLLKALSM